MKNRPIFNFILIATLLYSFSAFSQNDVAKNTNFRFNVSGGFGYVLAKVPEINFGSQAANDVFNDYYNKLKWAKTFQSSVHYRLKSNLFLGVKYLFLNTSASLENIAITSDLNSDGIFLTDIGDMSEKQYVNFFGPSLYAEMPVGTNWIFSSNFDFGWAFYRSENRTPFMEYNPYVARNYLITGNNLGANVDIGIDYFLNRNFSIGLKAGITSVNFKKLLIDNGTDTKQRDLDTNSRVNLSNVNLKLGISYLY